MSYVLIAFAICGGLLLAVGIIYFIWYISFIKGIHEKQYALLNKLDRISKLTDTLHDFLFDKK